MARNRKRTRDRQPRRPDDGAGRAIVGGSDFDLTPDLDVAPEPLEHATPDAELAEAQLALGRPEHAISDDDDDEEDFGDTFADEFDESADEFEAADDLGAPDAGGGSGVGGADGISGPGGPGGPGGGGSGRGGSGSGGGGGGRGGGSIGTGGSAAGGEIVLPGGAAVQRTSTVSRLIAFLQGSWRELQRVQWPDRRQVMQATGVVLGFVLVAGVYLGVADFVAQKFVHFILTK